MNIFIARQTNDNAWSRIAINVDEKQLSETIEWLGEEGKYAARLIFNQWALTESPRDRKGNWLKVVARHGYEEGDLWQPWSGPITLGKPELTGAFHFNCIRRDDHTHTSAWIDPAEVKVLADCLGDYGSPFETVLRYLVHLDPSKAPPKKPEYHEIHTNASTRYPHPYRQEWDIQSRLMHWYEFKEGCHAG